MTISARVSALAAAGLAATVWAAPAMAHESIEHLLFVPNRASADVAVIDTNADRLVDRVAVGNVPHQVAVSEALGKIVASNTEDNTISILDLDGVAPAATITLDVEPEHMQLGPNGALLAVGNIGAGTVSLVSLVGDREVARVDGLFEPHNLTFSADGSLLYVANFGANHVSVVDVAKAEVVNEIPVGDPTAVGALGASGAEFQGVINVTATVDGRLGFAAHGESGRLAVIDLETQRTVKTLELGDLPWRAYASPDGLYMVVPNNGDRTVSVISTGSLEVVATLPGAADMTGVNFSHGTAFVISRGENRIVVLDLDGLTRVGEIALPSTPETGVVGPHEAKLYVPLSGSGQVAVIDTFRARLAKTIDRVGDGPWGAAMASARNYCH